MKITTKNTGTVRPKQKTVLRTVQAATPVRWPTENEIRVRAYAIYQRRGCAPGQTLDDWLKAEHELVSKCGN
jgi:hypothetical protein